MSTAVMRALVEEVRSALASLLGYSRTLETQGERLTDEERREFVAGIARQTERLCHLTDQLRALTDRPEDPATVADASAMLRRVRDEVAPLAEARSTRIEVEAGGPVPVSMGPDVLHLVVRRLIVSALRYSQVSGLVRARATAQGDLAAVEVEVPQPRADVGGHSLAPAEAWPLVVGAAQGELGLHDLRPIVDAHGGDTDFHASTDYVSLCIHLRRPAGTARPSTQHPSRYQIAR